MKKFLPYILILTIIVQLFAPFSVNRGVKNNLEVTSNKAEAATECKFVSATYNPFTTITENRPDETLLQIVTSGCVGKFFKGDISKKALVETPMLNFPIQNIEMATISIRIKTGERYCDNKDCQTVLNLYLFESNTEEQELDSYESTRIVEKKDYLDFKCTANENGCMDSLAWGIMSAQGSSSWSIVPSVKSTSLTISGTGPTQNGNNNYTDTDTLTVSLFKLDNTLVKEEVYIIKNLISNGNIIYSTTFNDLTSSTGYNIKLKTRLGENEMNAIYTLTDSGTTYIPLPQDQKGQTTLGGTSGFPACELLSASTWGGCVGIVLYWLLFKSTSLIFGLTGKILDFTLMYSISDSAYRSGFVVQGWGIVRDFCNMFFIFVLLYIAFGTILGLHSVKTKEMIINVVIIGLLINFSLFATQVIIDASNILARVFYNQNTIVTGVKDPTTGVINNQLGEFGEIKLSEAIVSKVDPQKLVIEAKKVSGIKQDGIPNEDISAGSFIIVVLLATIVNIVGMIAFLSAGLIFIARVIGLWLAMIVSPLVFFSYTVPALQDMEMIGWKKWWPETLKLAFLAPVFAFFMYLVVGFMDKGMGVIDASRQDGVGLGFLVAIIVPFVFIMILLMKAKDIAKDMSGKMGQSITNGIAAAGGIVLGGAALGGALLGRKVIGAGLAKASKSESSMHLATQKIEHNKKLEEWETNRKNGIAQGPKPVFIAPKHGDFIKDANGNVKKDAKGNDIKFNNNNPFTHIGAALNAKQMRIGDIDHARHEMDETKKAAGLEGVDDVNLSGVNEKKLKDTFAKTKRSETETNVRKGIDGKGKPISVGGYQGEEAYKSANRGALVAAAKTDPNNLVKDKNGKTTGELTDEAKKKVENDLNVKLNAEVKLVTDDRLAKDFEKLRTESKQHVGGAERAFSRTNTGSWDIRKLSEAKNDQREGFMTKVPIALIAGIATGVRAGMKNVGVSNGGIKVEGNFMKDLGNTISDSLKGVKVNVDLSHVGEHKSSADSHGGGGHH